MTSFSIAGVAVGVATLVIVLSVMGGFENDLRNKLLVGQPHLEVLNDNPILGFSRKKTPLEGLIPPSLSADVSISQAYIQVDVIAKKGRYLNTATIFGVEPTKDTDVKSLWAFSQTMTEGDYNSIFKNEKNISPILLGESLAAQLNVELGDTLELLSPVNSSSDLLTTGGVIKQFTVKGIFRTGMFNYDQKWAVTSIGEARIFLPEYDQSLEDEDYITGYALRLLEPYHAPKFKEIKLPQSLKVETWMENNKALLFALKLEKFTMATVLMLIVLVASFSIAGTMMMNVYFKTKQISILRAIGMNQGDIRKIFLYNSLFISFVGLLFGYILGLGVCFFLAEIKSVPLPKGAFYIPFIPVKFLPFDYLVIGILCLGFAVIAAIYPANTAAKLDTSKGLNIG